MELSEPEKDALLRGNFNLTPPVVIRQEKIGCCQIAEYNTGLVLLQAGDLQIFLPSEDAEQLARWLLQTAV